MSDVLIAKSVSKRFRIKRNRPATFKESILSRLTGHYKHGSIFWALRDVGFSVKQGQALGIIGHNGAGKSTLLRLLCGLGRPTTGRIRCTGRIGSLLELGIGFHPDRTGRENLLTGGLLSGLTRRQALAKQDEIIAFAELEEFIDQPIRTYSNGMYLRLAFAASVHFDPDILIIDEVLTVGDVRFQQKCLDRLAAFRATGKTFVLTSHDSAQIRSLCDEVLVLEEGRVVMHGDPESAVHCYNDLMRQRSEKRAAQLSCGVSPQDLTVEHGKRLGTQEAEICAVRLYDECGMTPNTVQCGDSVTIEAEYRITKPMPDMALILGIYNEANIKCFETSISSVRSTFRQLATRNTLVCNIPELSLLPGRYYINIGLYPVDWSYVYDYHWQMHPLHIAGSFETPQGVSGVVLLHPAWSAPARTEKTEI